MCHGFVYLCFFQQNTAYEMRISDWSSDVCSSDLADFVVISTTPNAARAPYIEAEEASFNMEMPSMSFGFNIRGSPSTPSIRISAFPPWPIEVVPRTLKAGDWVGFPSSIRIFKLGTAPTNPCEIFGIGLFWKASAVT